MVAATCGLLTALGHAVASATPLPWRAMAAAFAAVTWAAVGVQAFLHGGFSRAQAAAAAGGTGGGPPARRWVRYLPCGRPQTPGAAAPAPPVSADVMSGGGCHAHHAAPAASADHDMAAGPPPGGMPAAHLPAALLCGPWLAYGERGVFRLRAGAGWLPAPLHQVFRVPQPPHRPRVPGRREHGWLPAPLHQVFRVPQPPHRPRMRGRREHVAQPLRRLLPGHTLTSRGPPRGAAGL
ncbi:hypothetical protein [Streptomyces sp. cmx-4-9]|uniref:hypothetical protein n=1 Tax=Streptomyces sp. cmx-4-9 TaxID=2790941 RepID=UPI00397FB7B4